MKFTAIWQAEDSHEFEWIDEILGPFIGEHVVDGKHEIVLDNAILIDAFIERHPKEYYQSFAGRNAFLVHFLDETYNGGYARYEPFGGVLRQFWSPVFESRFVRPFPLGYSNGFRGTEPIVPASKRPLAWSFAGAVGKSSRPEAVRAFGRLKPYTLVAPDGFEDKGLEISRERLSGPESRRLYEDTVFAPSPMGNVNIECYRVYEALESGCIPIVERRPWLDYYRDLLGKDHPIPTFPSWATAARFAEGLMAQTDRLDALQAECVAWWKGYKTKLTAEAGALFANPPVREPGERLVAPSAESSTWQHLELVRHQSLSSMGRRVGLLANRVVSSGRYRSKGTSRSDR